MSGQANNSNNPMFMALELGTGELSARLFPYLNPLDLQNFRSSSRAAQTLTATYFLRRLGIPSIENAIQAWKDDNAERTRKRIQYPSLWIGAGLSTGVLIWDFLCLQKLMYGSALLETPPEIRALYIGMPGFILMIHSAIRLMQLLFNIKNTGDLSPTRLSIYLPPMDALTTSRVYEASDYQPQSMGGLKAASAQEAELIIRKWKLENKKLKDLVSFMFRLSAITAFCIITLGSLLSFDLHKTYPRLLGQAPLLCFFTAAMRINILNLTPCILHWRYSPTSPFSNTNTPPPLTWRGPLAIKDLIPTAEQQQAFLPFLRVHGHSLQERPNLGPAACSAMRALM